MAAWMLVMWAALQQASGTDPHALQRMVATERAFAAATREIGIRDGFLTFFAPDAMRLELGTAPGTARVAAARETLASQARSPLPLPGRLHWEPFTGHISSDGTFGWLTGAYAAMDAADTQLLGQGAYFSVWKRQADGTWRVWFDEGVAFPRVWRDAAPFRVAPAPDVGTIGTPGETLDDAEREIAQGGDAWRSRLAVSVRIHRDGRMPSVGRDEAAAAAGDPWRGVTFTVARIERAASDDLGVSVGAYAMADGRTDGTWARVWRRDATGRWRVVFETSKRRQ